MFTVDRKSAEAAPFEKPGTYNVTIASVSPELTSKGDPSVKLIFRDEEGHVASDIITNKNTVGWKVNQLLAACPSVTVEEGAQFDFSKKEIFDSFMAQFKDAKLAIKLEPDTYKSGEELKNRLRVCRYIKSVGATEDVPF